MEKMKTFKDLKFRTVKSKVFPGRVGKLTFENGYGVSVSKIKGTQSSNFTWEVAVVGPDGQLCYDTPITNGVIGYQDAWEVAAIMKRIQALPKKGEEPEVDDAPPGRSCVRCGRILAVDDAECDCDEEAAARERFAEVFEDADLFDEEAAL